MWSGLICPGGNCSSCIGLSHRRLVVGQTVLGDELLLGLLRGILGLSRFGRSFVLGLSRESFVHLAWLGFCCFLSKVGS